MLKKTKNFEMIDLFIIMAIIIIIASLIMPNVITSIQKSKQKNIGHMNIIEKIKASKKTFNTYIQGIMGVNKVERELAESTEIFNKRHPNLWHIKPWDMDISKFNNSGQKKKEVGKQEVLNVKKN